MPLFKNAAPFILLLTFSLLLGCTGPDSPSSPPITVIIADSDIVDIDVNWSVAIDAVASEVDPGVDGIEEDITIIEIGPWDCAPDLDLDGRPYAHLEGAEEIVLRAGLKEMIRDHRSLGYDLARNEMFRDIDVDSEGYLDCIYSGRRVRRDGSRTPDGFNTEHTWPQSRGAREEPARSDLHHLFPIDAITNDVRGNYAFGGVSCQAASCPWALGGSLQGPGKDGRAEVFEVRPARRGDVARAIFYVSLRYEFPLAEQEEIVLRQWNCEDPPDTRERTRNDLIEVRQRNRNPFVDRPDFVDRLGRFVN